MSEIKIIEKGKVSLKKRIIIGMLYMLYALYVLSMFIITSAVSSAPVYALLYIALYIIGGIIIIIFGKKPFISVIAIFLIRAFYFVYYVIDYEFNITELLLFVLYSIMVMLIPLSITLKNHRKLIKTVSIVLAVGFIVFNLISSHFWQFLSDFSYLIVILASQSQFICLIILILAIDYYTVQTEIRPEVERIPPNKESKSKNDTKLNPTYNSNITSKFTGSTFGLVGINILTFLVNLLTLGLATPFMVVYKQKWMMKHTTIDGFNLKFDGNGVQLIGKWILWCLLTVLTLGIFIFFMRIRLKKWVVSHTDITNLENTEEQMLLDPPKSKFNGTTFGLAGIEILSFLLNVISLGIAIPFTVTMKEKWISSHTYISGHRLQFTGNGLQLLGKWVLWLLLTVVTLGVFLLFLPIRLKKWVTYHTHTTSVNNNDQISSAKDRVETSKLQSEIQATKPAINTKTSTNTSEDQERLASLEKSKPFEKQIINEELNTVKHNSIDITPTVAINPQTNEVSFAIDIKEEPDAFLIDAILPGIKKEDIQIKYSQTTLEIFVNCSETGLTDNNYIHKESKQCPMKRHITLEDVDAKKIKAKLLDGILHINAPKKEIIRIDIS